MPLVQRECLFCSKVFYTPSCQAKRGGRTCSLSCSAKLARSRDKRQSPLRVCETCGKTFKARSELLKIGRARYCSHKCRGPSVSLRMSGRRTTWLIKECIICKAPFETPPHYSERKLCSRACTSQYASRHNKYFNSSIELKIKSFMLEKGLPFEAQKKIGNVAFPDFVSGNVCIFADGDYWHNYPYGNDRDHTQDRKLLELGYKVVRFWERDINNNFEAVASKLLETLLPIQEEKK